MTRIENLNIARADRENDNALCSPADILQEALADVESGKLPCESLIVLALSKGENGNHYDVRWRASTLSGSQMIALLEIAKTTILREMGFVS